MTFTQNYLHPRQVKAFCTPYTATLAPLMRPMRANGIYASYLYNLLLLLRSLYLS